MRSVKCRDFHSTRSRLDASGPAVVAGAVVFHASVVDDGVLIHVVDMNAAEVIDGAVVVEGVTTPVSTLVSESAVAEAIVDSAVEADIVAPISVVEAVAATGESPISRGPQGAHIGRSDPEAGHPVVAGGGVVPISGGPEVALIWDGRLFVFGEGRWRLGGGCDRCCVVTGIAIGLSGYTFALVGNHGWPGGSRAGLGCRWG